jgi:hypothetical protein
MVDTENMATTKVEAKMNSPLFIKPHSKNITTKQKLDS